MHLYKFTRVLNCSLPTLWRLKARPPRRPRAWHTALSVALLCAGLAGYAQAGSLSATDDPSIALLRHLATQGDAGAQLQLGLAYRDGRPGLPADSHESMRWLERAASEGEPYAADALANLYATAMPELRDPSAALHWWRAAAEGGNADAAYQLGTQLAAEQPQQARHWLRLAADRGDRRAEQQLQQLCRRSQASAADLQRGHRSLDTLAAQLDMPALKVASVLWNLIDMPLSAMAPPETLRATAEQGDPVAEYQVAMRYLDGAWELRRDPVKGRWWLRRAAADGNPVAERTLADIGAKPI